MKRILVLVALTIGIFSFLIGRHNFIKTVETHRLDLPSNIELEQNLYTFEGRITNFDIEKSTMIFETKSPMSSKKIRYRILFKKQPDLMAEIIDHNYHYKIILDLNQNIFRSPKNPYGFDYDFYQFSQGIHGQFYAQDFITIDTQSSCLHCSRLKLREMISQNIDERYSSEVGSFLKAILLGDRSNLKNYNEYKDMGLAHIFAISGLHFGMIYKLLQKLAKFPDRQMKTGVSLIVLFAFSAWIGPSYSSYRAFALIGYLEVARLLHRNPDVMTGIAFSSLVILIIRPVAILSQSFQLSFYAYFCVAVIYRTFFGKKSISRISRLIQAVKFSIVLQILLLPATLYYFHQTNGYGFIANFVVVPLIGVILPIALIDLISTMFELQLAGKFISFILSLLVEGLEMIIGHLPHFVYRPTWFRPDDYGLLIGCLIVFIVLKSFHLSKNTKKYVLYSSISFILFGGIYNALPQNRLEIQFVDVGHGDFSVLKFKNRVILIDTGDGYMDCADYLYDQGILSVDAVIMSHAHQDHIGGIEKLATYFDIEHLYVNKETFDVLKSNEKLADSKLTLIDSPNKIYWNQVLIDIKPVESKVETNDNALVVKLKYHNKIGYFLGDISKETIDILLFDEVIDFVKVPHHGSKTSLSDSLYSDYSISSAVISHSTKYDMPSVEVIDLLDSNDIDVFSTYMNGMVQLNITKDNLILKSYLNDNR